MKLMIVAGSMLLPLVMYYSQRKWVRVRLVYNLLIIMAVLVFGNIASLSIYKIIHDNTVFMTAIHGVFLNPAFLTTGAYIVIYLLYRLLLLSIVEQLQR